MQLIIFIYTFFLVTFLIKGKFLFSILLLVLLFVTLVILGIIKKQKIEYYKNRIDEVLSNQNNIQKNEPFIDLHNNPWYILALIPMVTNKKAIQLARYIRQGYKFKNFKDFADFCEIPEQHRNLIKKIVKL